MIARPDLPIGWVFVAPAEVQEGDALLTPEGVFVPIGPDLLAPFPVGLRRLSWAVRKASID